MDPTNQRLLGDTFLRLNAWRPKNYETTKLTRRFPMKRSRENDISPPLIARSDIASVAMWPVDSIVLANVNYVVGLVDKTLPWEITTSANSLGDQTNGGGQLWSVYNKIVYLRDSVDADIIYTGATDEVKLQRLLKRLYEYNTLNRSRKKQTLIAALDTTANIEGVATYLFAVSDDLYVFMPDSLESHHVIIVSIGVNLQDDILTETMTTRNVVKTTRNDSWRKSTELVRRHRGSELAAWDVPQKPRDLPVVVYDRRVASRGTRPNRIDHTPRRTKFIAPYVTTPRTATTMNLLRRRENRLIANELSPIELYEKRIIASVEIVDDDVTTRDMDLQNIPLPEDRSVEVIIQRTPTSILFIAPELFTQYIDERTLSYLREIYRGPNSTFTSEVYALLSRYSIINFDISLPTIFFELLEGRYGHVFEGLSFPGRHYRGRNYANYWSLFDGDRIFGSQGVIVAENVVLPRKGVIVLAIPSSQTNMMIDRIVSIAKRAKLQLVVVVSGPYIPDTTVFPTSMVFEAESYVLAYGDNSKNVLTVLFTEEQSPSDLAAVRDSFAYQPLRLVGSLSLENALRAAWRDKGNSIRDDESTPNEMTLRAWIATEERKERMTITPVNYPNRLGSTYDRLLLFLRFLHQWNRIGEKERSYWILNLQYDFTVDNVDDYNTLFTQFNNYLARLNSDELRELFDRIL